MSKIEVIPIGKFGDIKFFALRGYVSVGDTFKIENIMMKAKISFYPWSLTIDKNGNIQFGCIYRTEKGEDQAMGSPEILEALDLIEIVK